MTSMTTRNDSRQQRAATLNAVAVVVCQQVIGMKPAAIHAGAPRDMKGRTL
jgi:hypothetical protein